MTQPPLETPTYATRLTAVAPAAIAVIELSGPCAEQWLMGCWQPASRLPKRVDAIRYGAWTGPRSNDSSPSSMNISTASEDVVICWTSNDTVEIHCHGGKQAATRIIEDLQGCGAIIQSSHDRIWSQVSDHYTAAARVDLEKASTEITTAILLDQARGALSQNMTAIQAGMESSTKHLPHRAAMIQAIDELRSRARYGMHLTQPWRLAIIGPPNSGKSNLLNAILGYDRAIVDSTAGTTRDVLNEHTSLLGWPFVVFDTAGLRETQDTIEQQGVKKAYEAIDTADLILLLVEPTQGWSSPHDQVYRSHTAKCIAVHSKSDLRLPVPKIPSELVATSISAQARQGLQTLYEIILQALIPIPPQPGQAVPFRKEHIAQLDQWRRQIELWR
jgi:tRNA modification GTPase